ncbi:hypothetical protein [Paenibacillus radicis (ex Gao et al. 2016)]|uniref:Uncharacterized protein n=1 Tax=Paenibacillus radicis (ex Gao et al. 2016) TaxID=1737354 RepID=A0A917LVH7_9BACL|nr:hypothetical protein [Paenibacillus radicis (ex Gao et al. 2016)]GGG60159.1 hypothetical protein GCM10010918_11710 [Paenibacillus radicis (ex Gao et al. 2016)]
MSEFTSGNLILTTYKHIVQKHNTIHVEELNNKWSVFITESTGASEAVPEDIMDITQEAPVLYFYNFEDHGWGFSIVQRGDVIATFDFSYEQEEIELMEYVQEKFPDQDHIELLYLSPDSDSFKEDMVQELEQLRSKEDRVKALINRLDVTAFSLFELRADQLEQLRQLLELENLSNPQNQYQLVEEFKGILDIEEMSWIGADRLE